MGLFDSLFKKAQPEKKAPEQEYEPVNGTGMDFYKDALQKLQTENPAYKTVKKSDLLNSSRRVYQYYYSAKNFALEEEPDNKFDKNAVKILADGLHIGYVKKGSAAHIKNLIKDGKIASITGEIKGGKYKGIVDIEKQDDPNDPESVCVVGERLGVCEAPFSVKLKLFLKD